MKINSISNYLRGVAITGVVAENFLSWIRINSSSNEILLAVKFIEFFGASLVHIFFFLSGYSLMSKYQDFEKFSWKLYAANRFSMIVIPYWIVVMITYFFINILHVQNPVVFETSFELSDLFSHLLFIRNFNESAWGMNPALWFMQVIFGLYIIFPLLLYFLYNHSLKKMLLISALIAYLSRIIFWAFGYQPNRESSIFLFYVFEFAAGMAFVRIEESTKIGIKLGSSNLIYGLFALAGYSISFFLKIIIAIGANLHEVFTYVGSVAIGIFSYQTFATLKLEKIEKTFYSIGHAAFLIYLTHAPPIQHLIRPILEKYFDGPQNILLVFTLFIAYFIIIVSLSKWLTKYFKALSAKIETNIKKRIR